MPIRLCFPCLPLFATSLNTNQIPVLPFSGCEVPCRLFLEQCTPLSRLSPSKSNTTGILTPPATTTAQYLRPGIPSLASPGWLDQRDRHHGLLRAVRATPTFSTPWLLVVGPPCPPLCAPLTFASCATLASQRDLKSRPRRKERCRLWQLVSAAFRCLRCEVAAVGPADLEEFLDLVRPPTPRQSSEPAAQFVTMKKSPIIT